MNAEVTYGIYWISRRAQIASSCLGSDLSQGNMHKIDHFSAMLGSRSPSGAQQSGAIQVCHCSAVHLLNTVQHCSTLESADSMPGLVPNMKAD